MGYHDYDEPTRVERIKADIQRASHLATAAVAIREIGDHRYDPASAIWVLADIPYRDLDQKYVDFLIHTIEKIDELRAKLADYLSPHYNHLKNEATIEAYYRTHWRAFTNWLVVAKRLAVDPLAAMKRRSHQDVEQKQTRRAFTAKELKRLTRNARRSGETHYGLTGQQRTVLYCVASETGYRVQELASITPGSITWGDDPAITINCTISKRRRTDRQEIKVSTAMALRKLCRGLSPDQKIWLGRWWERSTRMLRCDMEGIDESTPEGHLSFHSLRHTFVTNVARTGIDLQMILNICRLSTPTLLQRYYHTAEGQRRNVINQLP